jgi:AraC-like DNA-binding protein
MDTVFTLNAQAACLAQLFDFIEELQFWIKDAKGCYAAVNRGFLTNYGSDDASDILGKTDFDLSPAYIAAQFRLDDERVLAGHPVLNRIELVGRYDHTAAWCVTNKVPVRNDRGRVMGTSGTTRAHTEKGAGPLFPDAKIARVLARLQFSAAGPLDNLTLARLAGLSVRAFERRFGDLFHLTPQDYIRRLRVRLACHALVFSSARLDEIATAHGFCDQSHFGRQFLRETGMTPRAYRKQFRPAHA